MVNLFCVILCGLLACSVCEEEITYMDIVTFIQDLYPDLIETKTDILETTEIIPTNVWDNAAIHELIINLDPKSIIMYTQLNLERKLRQNEQYCVLTLIQEALDTQIFMDNEFNKRCHYEKYWDTLQAHYSSLTSAEDSAKNIVNDFINANMWCSNNGDLPSCYSQVHKSIIEKGAIISSIIQTAKDELEKVEDEYDKISEECAVEATFKIMLMDWFVEKTVLFCL